jgi:acyl-CoA thioesterase YciA
MREVDFVAPVHLGDTVTFYTRTARKGKRSVTVDVEVDAERSGPGGNREVVRVTSATIVYVAIDQEGRSAPLDGFGTSG